MKIAIVAIRVRGENDYVIEKYIKKDLENLIKCDKLTFVRELLNVKVLELKGV